MAYKVYNYFLPITDRITLEHLPVDAQLLKFGSVKNSLCLWVLTDPEVLPTKKRVFRLAGTGHLIEENELLYVGTTTNQAGVTYHLFEVL